MFNKKTKGLMLEPFHDVLKNRLDNIVFCEECGVAVKKEKAKKIKIEERRSYLAITNGKYGTTEDSVEIFKYYCDRHSPEYDRVISCPLNSTPPIYFKDNIEVDKKGQIIKGK